MAQWRKRSCYCPRHLLHLHDTCLSFSTASCPPISSMAAYRPFEKIHLLYSLAHFLQSISVHRYLSSTILAFTGVRRSVMMGVKASSGSWQRDSAMECVESRCLRSMPTEVVGDGAYAAGA